MGVVHFGGKGWRMNLPDEIQMPLSDRQIVPEGTFHFQAAISKILLVYLCKLLDAYSGFEK